MKKLLTFFIAAILTTGFTLQTASAQDAKEAKTAEQIMKESHLAYFYAGDDGLADVHMAIVSKRGKERIRQFAMLRLDVEEGGQQKYYTYFKKPSDVARTTFMVHKSNNGNDLRWIYIPSIDLIKPISADDKNSSFVGSDFSYEDVSGRHWTEDNHTIKGEEKLGDKDVYVIESIPKEEYKGFARKVSYIDKETKLPLKEEYYDKKDKHVRTFTAEKIEVIDGITTVTVRKMEDVKKGGYTTVTFNEIIYNQGVKEDIFTERYLKNPPREYISN